MVASTTYFNDFTSKLQKFVKCYQQSYMVNKSPENYYCWLDTKHISLGLNIKKERAPDDNYVCIKEASKGCFICAKNKTKMLTFKKKKKSYLLLWGILHHDLCFQPSLGTVHMLKPLSVTGRVIWDYDSTWNALTSKSHCLHACK